MHTTIHNKVSLRKYPYPYRSALTLCSDIDDTQSTEDFLEIQRFLCTTENTSMGKGIGLEIGNSFYFHDDEFFFSYFTGDEQARQVTIDLIKAGYIDSIHSFGDTALTRQQALESLEELHQAGAFLQVWINHNGSVTNIGQKFAYLFPRTPVTGDDPASESYHTDATLGYGIRYAWVGSVTRVIGQMSTNGKLAQVLPIFDLKYPFKSGMNIAKELIKSIMGWRNDERFVIQHENNLIRPYSLGDGQQLWEFSRYCNHPLGVPPGDTGYGLAYVISPAVLKTLIQNEGISIVYTHFGQNGGAESLFTKETQDALRQLAFHSQEGNIFITTTFRLLRYVTTRDYLDWSFEVQGDKTLIRLHHINDLVFGKEAVTADKVQGLTFYVDDPEQTTIFIGDREVNTIHYNGPDYTGRTSVSIPFQTLTFPEHLR